ncbi:MAG: VOC family protein [Anaerolineae bacterium]
MDMEIGAFSLNLTVNDLSTSQTFYEKLGFIIVDGNPDDGWIMLSNGKSYLGLFQGMFESNIISFHPPQSADLRQELLAKGLITDNTDNEELPSDHIMLTDPDGNVLMIDPMPAEKDDTE